MKLATWLLIPLAFSSCILPALAAEPEQDPVPEKKEWEQTHSPDELPVVVGGIDALSSAVNELVAEDAQPVLALCAIGENGTVISVNGITKSLEQFLDKDFKAIKEKAKRDVHLIIAVIVTDKVPSRESFKKIEEAILAKDVSDCSVFRFRFAEPKEETKPEAKAK